MFVWCCSLCRDDEYIGHEYHTGSGESSMKLACVSFIFCPCLGIRSVTDLVDLHPMRPSAWSQALTCACIHTVHAYTHTHTHIRMDRYMHAHTRTCTHACTHTHTHTHTRMDTHTHMHHAHLSYLPPEFISRLLTNIVYFQVLWLALRFFQLVSELSVLVLGLLFGKRSNINFFLPIPSFQPICKMSTRFFYCLDKRWTGCLTSIRPLADKTSQQQ